MPNYYFICSIFVNFLFIFHLTVQHTEKYLEYWEEKKHQNNSYNLHTFHKSRQKWTAC